MHPFKESLTIAGQLDEVTRASNFVGMLARSLGLSEQSIHHCILAVDETCTNIIEHGYEYVGEGNRIEIICTGTDNKLIIEVRDEGPEFNPLAQPDPDPNLNLEDRKTGGWGIFFTKKVMDDVQYVRSGPYNILTLIKYRSQA